MSFFRDNALRAVSRGFSVIPCDVRDKGPYGLNARTKAMDDARTTAKQKSGPLARLTREEQAQIKKLHPMKGIYSKTNTLAGVESFAAEVAEDANYGICSDDNFIIFETDDSKRLRELLPQPLPKTLAISARANRGYFIFKQTDESRAVNGILEVPGLFELRNNGYCVGYGSIHPDTGKEYALVCDAEPTPFPDWLLPALKEIHKNTPAGVTPNGATGEVDKDALEVLLDALHKRGEPRDMLGLDKVSITSLHPTLKALAAHLYKGPDTSEEVIEILWAVGNEYCTDREPAEKDIDDVIGYMERNDFTPCFCKKCDDATQFNLPPAFCDGLHIFATEEEYAAHMKEKLWEQHQSNASVVADLDCIPEVSEEGLPSYPDVWRGTEYAEFADICRKGNKIPREFFIESVKTVMGSMMGSNVTVQGEYGPITGAIPRFYTVLLAEGQGGKGTSIDWTLRLFEHTGSDGTLVQVSPLWWGSTDPANVPWKGCGACHATFNSVPGLGKFQKQKRLIQTYGELSTLINNTGMDASGEGLLAVLRDLYDSTRFHVGATARRDAFTGNIQHSLLAGTTPELWGSMFAKKQVEGSGLFQRFNIIPTGRIERCSLYDPPLDIIRDRLYERLSTLDEQPVALHIPRQSLKMLDDWFNPMANDPDNQADDYGRLNVLALRNALHLAFSRDIREIGQREMGDAIALSQYQLAVRLRYKPASGYNDYALVEDEVRRIVRSTKKVKLRDVKRKLRKYGSRSVDFAVTNLSDELQVVETSPEGGGPTTKWLLWPEFHRIV